MPRTVGYAAYMRVRTKPAKREEFIRLITELRTNVLQHEPDTYVFEIMQGADENEFVFFECFKGKAAQKFHQDQPYHVAMAPLGWACLEDGPIIEFLQPAL
jgi:quinol monooxygenase YgiN